MEKVSDIIPFFKSNLNQIGDEKEIISWAYLSIKHVLGINRSECIVYKDQKLSKSSQLELQDITQDLSTQMPIQYILGNDISGECLPDVNQDGIVNVSDVVILVDFILD